MRRRFGEDARSVRSFMHFNGRLSGGTMATGILLDEAAEAVQALRRDPFALGGAPPGGARPEDADPSAWRDWAPVGRVGWPAETARTILFLASDLSSFITGHNIPVDGGSLAQSGWTWSPRAGRFVNRPTTQ